MSRIKVSEKEGQSLIENYLKTQKVQFLKYELLPISEVAEGYLGEHYNFRVTYLQGGKTQTADFFIKHTPTQNKHQVDIANETNIYAREIFMYDVLLKEFKKLGFDTSFAAESFYCIPNKAIIMENLKNKGYITLDRNKRFNLDESKCALKALAAYHGAGFAYQKLQSLKLGRNYKLTDDFNEFLEEYFFIQYVTVAKSNCVEDFWAGSRRTLTTLVDLLPQDEPSKVKFQNYMANYKLGRVFAQDTKYKKTLGHGDLWSNNLLFKMNGDKAVTCCLCDYQVLRYFYPSFDVMLIIYSNTDKPFRSKYFRELCEYYYDTLAGIYQNYGFALDEILSKVDFEETCEMVKIDMLIQVVCVSAITCIPKEVLNEKNRSGEDSQEVFFDNYKISAKAFQTNAVYRKIITELLTELYDTFEANSNKLNI